MQALRTYQRAVDRYGLLEALRRAPRAVKDRALSGLSEPGAPGSWAGLISDDHARDVITRSGLDPGKVVVVTDARFGTQVARKSSTDWSTYRQIFLRQDWKFRGRMAAPRTVIDLGANVGYASVWYHVNYPAARIVAIEPDARNCATARVNIALGCRDGADITLEQTAIWHTDSWLKIKNPDGKASGTAGARGAGAESRVPFAPPRSARSWIATGWRPSTW